jgi:hypothetical protein
LKLAPFSVGKNAEIVGRLAKVLQLQWMHSVLHVCFELFALSLLPCNRERFCLTKCEEFNKWRISVIVSCLQEGRCQEFKAKQAKTAKIFKNPS